MTERLWSIVYLDDETGERWVTRPWQHLHIVQAQFRVPQVGHVAVEIIEVLAPR